MHGTRIRVTARAEIRAAGASRWALFPNLPSRLGVIAHFMGPGSNQVGELQAAGQIGSF